MRTFFVAMGLVAVVVVAATLALLAASAPASCNDANAARTAGLYVQSANGYISVLGKQPRSTCAASGMAKLCVRADKLIPTEPQEANAIFTAMFAHEPEASRPNHKPYMACAEVGEKLVATTATNGGSTTSTSTSTATSTSTSSTSTTNTKTTTTAQGAGTGTTNVTVTVNATVPAGRRGPKGDPGTPGRNGTNGTNGANGRNGRNGTTEVIVCPTTRNCGAG